MKYFDKLEPALKYAVEMGDNFRVWAKECGVHGQFRNKKPITWRKFLVATTTEFYEYYKKLQYVHLP